MPLFDRTQETKLEAKITEKFTIKFPKDTYGSIISIENNLELVMRNGAMSISFAYVKVFVK